MRLLPLLAAWLLSVASAGLVACGGDSGDIPADDASSLERTLDTVASQTAAGNCAAAEDAVAKANGVVVKLPDSVNARLRARLNDGLQNLARRVRVRCEGQAPTQTQAQEQQPSTTSTPQTDTGQTDTGQTGTGTTPPTETQPQDTTGTGTTPPPTTGTTPPATDQSGASGDGTTGGTPSGQGSGG